MTSSIERPWDVIIIGGAAAGLTAALYASRRGLRTLILTADLGGQMGITDEIANYPGINFITGPNLTTAIHQQVTEQGVTTIIDRVVALEPGQPHRVHTTQAVFETRAVILAFGLSPRLLDADRETELVGRGVSYDVDAQSSRHHGQSVAVVGGGNAAVSAALRLAGTASTVHLIHRRDTLSAEQALQQQLLKAPNIICHLSHEVTKLEGVDHLTGIIIRDNVGKIDTALTISQLIIHIGFISATQWLEGVVDRNDRGMITIDDRCRTNQPGIFAAGDVTTIPYRQIVISAGEGAKAAIAAVQYLAGQEDITPIVHDWGLK